MILPIPELISLPRRLHGVGASSIRITFATRQPQVVHRAPEGPRGARGVPMPQTNPGPSGTFECHITCVVDPEMGVALQEGSDGVGFGLCE